MARMRLGEMLVSQGRLDAAQLQSALAHQRQWGGRLGRAIVQLGFLGEGALLETLGAQLGVPFVEIGDREIPAAALAAVPRKLVAARRVLPLELRADGRRGPLVVALADAGDLGVLDEIAFVTGLSVRAVLAGEEDLDRAIERHYDLPARARTVTRFTERQDAIELPPDAGPLGGERGGGVR